MMHVWFITITLYYILYIIIYYNIYFILYMNDLSYKSKLDKN